LSIYPNVVRMRVIEDPEIRVIPWQNILTLIGCFGVFWMIRVRWLRFWVARVDPMLEDVTDTLEEAGTGVLARAGRLAGRLRRLFKSD
jgi:hypothetical protein